MSNELHLTLSEFDKLKKRLIGYGKEGSTYKYRDNKVIKLYHQKLSDIINNYNRIEYLADKNRLKNNLDIAVARQSKVTRSRLPKREVFINQRFAGCELERIHGIELHKLMGLPLSIRKKIMLDILKDVKELIENNIYHLDLDNSPFSKDSILKHDDGTLEHVGHSHVLVDYRLIPHLIDLEGRSTIYTLKKDEFYEQLSISSLNKLLIEFLLLIDLDEYTEGSLTKSILQEKIDNARVEDKNIEALSDFSLDISALEEVIKNSQPSSNKSRKLRI